ncbi:hypothetical protein NFHSH190041_28980 [Shewanella sp. NFH-SH190041]|uniref:hypothetical protein n=1 Tax=Shewanella sp. NFH-SH190041 TaxID=2950245 RepID=UPI0021C4733C|nr:hypothetical protein [Shewanella sp. NFH-SH190041]BDM65446.1 hypothetical protein NFHSH190041_28980 [Shewanella sp. NFH-SH190041]
MITTFYFDGELFDDPNLKNQALSNSVLLENWRNFGCLVSNDKSYAEINSAIKNVAPKYYQKWVIALSNFKRFNVNGELRKLSDFQSFNDLKGSVEPLGVKTTIIPYDYLELYKTHLCNDSGFEIVTPVNINESIHFIDSEKYSKTDIVPTDIISEIWKTRFHELAKYSKVITIIDRFSVKNIMEDYDKGEKTSIESFVEFLDKTGQKFSVKLYGACDIGGDVTNIKSFKLYLDNVLRKRPCYNRCILNFDVSLCKNKLFGKTAHDRMLRFDSDHVVQIGNGLDIFRTTKILDNIFNVKRPEFTNFTEIHNTLQKNIEPGCACL